MGELIEQSVLDAKKNRRDLWETKKPAVPIDTADCGKVLKFKKRPGRALVAIGARNDGSLLDDNVELMRPCDSGSGD